MQIRADLALFETKSRAKGSVTVFEQEMDARYMDRQKLKDDLREALASNTLSVAYQPMFVPDGTRIECCEALSRWTHAERGPVRIYRDGGRTESFMTTLRVDTDTEMEYLRHGGIMRFVLAQSLI